MGLAWVSFWTSFTIISAPTAIISKHFSADYFTDRYKNEWGEAINFDGPDSEPVRDFFFANAAYWVDEYHLDGLRLDATQQIFDSSADHILTAIGRRGAQSRPRAHDVDRRGKRSAAHPAGKTDRAGWLRTGRLVE